MITDAKQTSLTLSRTESVEGQETIETIVGLFQLGRNGEGVPGKIGSRRSVESFP